MHVPFGLFRSVIEDLIFLRDEWDHEVTTVMLRNTSVVLRRLIVDGHLLKVLNLAYGSETPMVSVPDTQRIVSLLDVPNIAVMNTGEVYVDGLRRAGAPMLAKNLSPDAMRAIGDACNPKNNIEIRLSAFPDTVSMIALGHLVTNRQVIQYVSNKLGGAHFDPSRTGERDEVFAKLDATHVIIYGQKPAPYYQLLAIGQTLTRTKSIMKLVDEFSRLAVP